MNTKEPVRGSALALPQSLGKPPGPGIGRSQIIAAAAASPLAALPART